MILKANLKTELKRVSVKDKKPTFRTNDLKKIYGFIPADTILIEILVGGEAIKRTFHSSRGGSTYYADKVWDNEKTMPNIKSLGGPTSCTILSIEYVNNK